MEGKIEDSVAKFGKAVEIDNGLFGDVVSIYVNHLSRPDLALSAAGDDLGRLEYVARVLEDMQYNDLAEQSRARAKELLEIKCFQGDVSARTLASLANIYHKRSNYEEAIEYYRRALELDYGQVHWRYTLAQLLVETDRIPEAMNEARICIRLKPQFKAAKRLVAELSVNPASFDGEIE